MLSIKLMTYLLKLTIKRRLPCLGGLVDVCDVEKVKTEPDEFEKFNEDKKTLEDLPVQISYF